MRKQFFALFTTVAIALPLSAEIIVQSPRDGINAKGFHIDKSFQRNVKFVDMDGGKVMEFNGVGELNKIRVYATGYTSVKRYAGRKVRFSIEYKYEFTQKGQNGGVFCNAYNPLPAGVKYKNMKYLWDGMRMDNSVLKSEWKKAEMIIDYPKEMKEGSYSFGVEKAMGKAWFRNMKIETVDSVKQ